MGDTRTRRFSPLAALSILLAISSTHSKADPVTAAQSVANAAGFVLGVIDSRNTSRWRAEASGKLQEIHKINTQILEELRSLRVFITGALEQQYRNELVIDAISLSNAFDVRMAAPRPDRNQINNIRTLAELNSFKLTNVGPTVYKSTYASVLLTVATHRTLGASEGETRKFLDQVIPAFVQWDANQPGTLHHSLNSARAEVARITNQIRAVNGRRVVHVIESTKVTRGGGRSLDGPRFEDYPCQSEVLATVSVSEPAFIVSVTAIEKRDRTCGPPADPHEITAKIQTGVNGLVNQLNAAISAIAPIERQRALLLEMIANLRRLRAPQA